MMGIDIKDINGKTEGYWNQFRNNLNRNGYIESEQLLNNTNPDVLSEFILFNPYPNPFNPSTSIKYYIPEASQVQISIHDIMGRKVDVLENKFKHKGYYSIEWEASSLSSGKYFVYLITDNIKLSQSITLIK